MAGWEATNNENDPFFAANRKDYSMGNMIDMPGGPRVDHYYGRGVSGVVAGDDDGQDSVWEIILAGDVVIRNYDPDTPQPTNDLGGMQMVGATFSELETTLIFRLGSERSETVTLNPNKYSISDPNVIGGESFPQRPPELDEDDDIAIEIDDESDIVLDAESAPKGTEDEGAEEDGNE